MKEKTSITLSKDVLAGIDQLTGSGNSRSAVIESVLRRYLRERKRAEAHAHDLKLINRAAEQLNAEAADVLGYQASVETTDLEPQ
jgi:metal-responsive CopG/Arc/MetJ family transcriptional regulator